MINLVLYIKINKIGMETSYKGYKEVLLFSNGDMRNIYKSGRTMK